MKTFIVEICYSYEGDNGYDHHCHIKQKIKARNSRSAMVKAKRHIPSYGEFLYGSAFETEFDNEIKTIQH